MDTLKVQIKYADSLDPSIAKTIEIPHKNASNTEINNFATAYGSLINSFVLTENVKVEYTKISE